jgi:hypothetical protein
MVIKNELITGVAIALASFLWICLEFLVGMHDRYIDYHLYIAGLIYAFPAIGVYWAVRKRYYSLPPGEFKIKDGLMSGVIIIVTAAFLNLFLQFIFFRFINPDYFGNMIAASAKKAIMTGGNSILAIQEAQEKYNLSTFLLQNFMNLLILGLFISLMTSFRLIKKGK